MSSPPKHASSSVLKIRLVDGTVFVAAEGCPSVDVLRADQPTRTFVEENGELREVGPRVGTGQPLAGLTLPWRDATATRYSRIF